MGDNRIENTDNVVPVSTRQLVQDYVNFRLSVSSQQQNGWNPPSLLTPEMEALRNIGEEFESRYRHSFDDIFSNLEITELNAHDTFLQVVDELFIKGITWARIVAMFAFGGVMAVKCAHNHMPTLAEGIVDWMTDYIDEKLMVWINDNGAWNGFMQWVNQRDDHEEDRGMFRKIFCGVGLAVGALALGTFLATKS